MLAYMDTKRSKASFRLSYVVHSTPPLTFTNLKEKLHHLIPIDVSSTSYVRDRKIIFTYLDTSIEDPTARAWLETDNHHKNNDGRGVWVQVKRIDEGDDNREEYIREQQEHLEHTKYMGHVQCNAKKTASRLIRLYQSLYRSTKFTTLTWISCVICAIICMSKIRWRPNIG